MGDIPAHGARTGRKPGTERGAPVIARTRSVGVHLSPINFTMIYYSQITMVYIYIYIHYNLGFIILLTLGLLYANNYA